MSIIMYMHVTCTCTTPTFVAVDVEVVGCREDGDERGEAGGLTLAVHLVAGVLRLVGSDNGEEVVTLEELTAGAIAVRGGGGGGGEGRGGEGGEGHCFNPHLKGSLLSLL